MVHDQTLIVFCLLRRFSAWALLSCRVHEVWASFFGATLKDDSRYTRRRLLRDLPLSQSFEGHRTLEAAGQAYYDFRAALMVRNNEGLTKTYNRFHDPGEMSTDIVELRRLHDAMDRAVLDAYGWANIQPVCDFFPEFDEKTRTTRNPPARRSASATAGRTTYATTCWLGFLF